jgi:hypothetical protein
MKFSLTFVKKRQTLDLDVMLGIMRLSHKYQIEGLQQGMQQRLQEDWPLKYSDYLARLKFLGSPGYRIPQAIKLIETAQRCQAHELLPTAFYELACAWGTGWAEISNVLSPENVVRLTHGLARSQQRLREFLDGENAVIWKASPPQTIWDNRDSYGACSDVCGSGDGWSIVQNKLSEHVFDGLFAHHALIKCSRNTFMDDCTSCNNWFVGILKNKVQEVWECIPEDFNLPPVDPELYSQSATRIL